MPVHRCSSDALEECVARIEASRERIVSVAEGGPGAYVIVTYLPTPVKERR